MSTKLDSVSMNRVAAKRFGDQWIVVDGGKIIFSTVGGNDQFNAQRLAAMWDVCSGLSTEVLQSCTTYDNVLLALARAAKEAGMLLEEDDAPH